MNLPNCLTIARMLLTVVFVFFLYQNTLLYTVLAAFVFTAASLTDYFDGKIAQKRKLITNFGKIMDPIADKVLMLSAFILFMQMGVIASWMVLIILLREVTVTASRLLAMRSGLILAAEKLGKIKTVLQIVSISVILLFLILEKSFFQMEGWYRREDILLGLINCLMFVTVGVTLVSGITYFKHKRKIITAQG